MAKEYIHDVQIYYEDTDFSGVVYHANYLKFCERAREHAIGQEKLIDLYNNSKLGFAVYKLDIIYKEGAIIGDSLQVKTTIKKGSEYRWIFKQDIYRKGEDKAIVCSNIELVCLLENKKMVAFPKEMEDLI